MHKLLCHYKFWLQVQILLNFCMWSKSFPHVAIKTFDRASHKYWVSESIMDFMHLSGCLFSTSGIDNVCKASNVMVLYVQIPFWLDHSPLLPCMLLFLSLFHDLVWWSHIPYWFSSHSITSPYCCVWSLVNIDFPWRLYLSLFLQRRFIFSHCQFWISS